jgi:hypothetical protein
MVFSVWGAVVVGGASTAPHITAHHTTPHNIITSSHCAHTLLVHHVELYLEGVRCAGGSGGGGAFWIALEVATR